MASNIKENILEMKNLSELMVDLAYSAVFLSDLNITREVNQLLQRIKWLESDTTKLIFRIKESEQDRMVLLEFIDYIKDISNGANNIANLVQNESIPSIINDILKSTDERVIIETIPKSHTVNKKIGDLRIRSHTGARIVAIKRKEKWNFKTNKTTKINTNDFIVALGTSDAEKKLKELLKK